MFIAGCTVGAASTPAPTAARLKAVAAQQYLAAARVADSKFQSLGIEWSENLTLDDYRKTTRKYADAILEFDNALLKIHFPPSIVGDAKALLSLDTTQRTLYLNAAEDTDLLSFNADMDRARAADANRTAAAAVLRTDLGLAL